MANRNNPSIAASTLKSLTLGMAAALLMTAPGRAEEPQWPQADAPPGIAEQFQNDPSAVVHPTVPEQSPEPPPVPEQPLQVPPAETPPAEAPQPETAPMTTPETPLETPAEVLTEPQAQPAPEVPAETPLDSPPAEAPPAEAPPAEAPPAEAPPAPQETAPDTGTIPPEVQQQFSPNPITWGDPNQPQGQTQP